MYAITSFNQSLEYIEDHLTQPITVQDVAAAAGYSRHHFSRTFLALTGLTPTSYLRKRRLSEAARDLVTTSKRILDIALDYQFGSQEAFTRSFRREFGVNPGRYRQQGRLCRAWGKISLGLSNLLYPGQGINLAPKLIVPERRIVEAVLTARPRAAHLAATVEEIFQLGIETNQRVTIRLAHRQDIPALCGLYYELHELTRRGVPQRLKTLDDYECFDATSLSSSLRKLIDSLEVAIWVAEVDGAVIGLAEVYLREDTEREMLNARRFGYLQSLVVSYAWRGHGIGVQLLDAAEAWARERDAIELRLDTWEFEDGPLAFYERQGFRSLRRTLVRELAA